MKIVTLPLCCSNWKRLSYIQPKAPLKGPGKIYFNKLNLSTGVDSLGNPTSKLNTTIGSNSKNPYLSRVLDLDLVEF